MPKRSAKQRESLKATNKQRTRLALRHAWRLSPYIAAWQAEGLSQRAIAAALNEAGAVVPSEWRPEPYQPAPVKQWSLLQVQRLLAQIDDARKRMAFYAKRRKADYVTVWGKGAGLFARPELAPLPAENEPRPQPDEPPNRRSVEWYAWNLEQTNLAITAAHAAGPSTDDRPFNFRQVRGTLTMAQRIAVQRSTLALIRKHEAARPLTEAEIDAMRPRVIGREQDHRGRWHNVYDAGGPDPRFPKSVWPPLPWGKPLSPDERERRSKALWESIEAQLAPKPARKTPTKRSTKGTKGSA